MFTLIRGLKRELPDDRWDNSLSPLTFRHSFTLFLFSSPFYVIIFVSCQPHCERCKLENFKRGLKASDFQQRLWFIWYVLWKVSQRTRRTKTFPRFHLCWQVACRLAHSKFLKAQVTKTFPHSPVLAAQLQIGPLHPSPDQSSLLSRSTTVEEITRHKKRRMSLQNWVTSSGVIFCRYFFQKIRRKKTQKYGKDNKA